MSLLKTAGQPQNAKVQKFNSQTILYTPNNRVKNEEIFPWNDHIPKRRYGSRLVADQKTHIRTGTHHLKIAEKLTAEMMLTLRT